MSEIEVRCRSRRVVVRIGSLGSRIPAFRGPLAAVLPAMPCVPLPLPESAPGRELPRMPGFHRQPDRRPHELKVLVSGAGARTREDGLA